MWLPPITGGGTASQTDRACRSLVRRMIRSAPKSSQAERGYGFNFVNGKKMADSRSVGFQPAFKFYKGSVPLKDTVLCSSPSLSNCPLFCIYFSSILCFSNLVTLLPSLFSPAPHSEFSQYKRGGLGGGGLRFASQQGSSSVGDAWLLDGKHATHRGPAAFCLLKRLQMPLSVCLSA